jgi:hypothetical protein
MPPITTTVETSVRPCRHPTANVIIGGTIDLPGSTSTAVETLIQSALDVVAAEASNAQDVGEVTLTYDSSSNQVGFEATVGPDQDATIVIPIFKIPSTPSLSLPVIGSVIPTLTITYEVKVSMSQPAYAQLSLQAEVDVCVEVSGLSLVGGEDVKKCGADLPTCSPWPSGSSLAQNFDWAACFVAGTACQTCTGFAPFQVCLPSNVCGTSSNVNALFGSPPYEIVPSSVGTLDFSELCPPAPPMPKVNVEFTVAGDVSDIDASTQTVIKQVIADAAGVAASAVSLTLSSGSVRISAEITFADDSSAESAAVSMSSGIFARSSSLENALAAGGASVTVSAITQAPSNQDSSGGGSGGDSPVGIIVGVLAGVSLLTTAGFAYMRQQKKHHANNRVVPSTNAYRPQGPAPQGTHSEPVSA